MPDTQPATALRCLRFSDHQWERVGSHRVPCYGSWSTNRLPKPDGTISYADFRCKLCGENYSEEELYSWRPKSRRK